MRSSKNSKKCLICGSSYSYCPNCGSTENYWKMTFCSENCLSLYRITTGLRDGLYTLDEAYNLLKDCDTSVIDSESFNEDTKKIIERILNSQVSPVVEKVKDIFENMDNTVVEEEVIESETTVEESEEPVAENNESANFKKEKNSYGKYNKNFHNKK